MTKLDMVLAEYFREYLCIVYKKDFQDSSIKKELKNVTLLSTYLSPYTWQADSHLLKIQYKCIPHYKILSMDSID